MDKTKFEIRVVNIGYGRNKERKYAIVEKASGAIVNRTGVGGIHTYPYTPEGLASCKLSFAEG